MATFGDQFESGQRFAQGLLGTYRDARQRRQLRDINDAQVQQLPPQYTVEDGDQLRAIAAARDPNGNPYYNLTPSADGLGYQVQPNFDAPTVGVAPRQQFRYLGQSFNSAPTPVQMDRAKLRALADVIGQDDPVRAAGVLSNLRADERADQHLGLAVNQDARAQTSFQAAQDDRSERKGIEADRRAFVKQLQAMPEDQLAESLGGAFSADGSGVDAMLTYDPKSKQFIFASKIPGMPSTVMSKAEAIQHAAGVWEMGNGDFTAGMKMVMDGLREQRRMGERQQDLAFKAAEGNATADYRNQSLGLRRQELANQHQERQAALADRQEARKERAADRAERTASQRAQATQLVEDDQGNLVGVTPVFDPKSGAVSYTQAPLGKGLRKPGSVKTLEEQWTKIEQGMGGMPAEEVRARREDFFASRGVAPDSAMALIRSPVNPQTGKPWTRQDYEAFNRRFPKSKVPVPGNGATGSF